MPPVRLFIIDKNSNFLQAARDYLMLDPRWEVLGTASSAGTAMEKIWLLQPQFVMLDWSIGDMGAAQAVQLIKSLPDPPWVILLISHGQPQYQKIMRSMGADGYICKEDFAGQLPLLFTLLGTKPLVESSTTITS